MLIDSSSRRNLELVETLREKNKRGSLLWVLDKTKTAMGARTLRSYVEQPLIDPDEINNRLEALEELNKNPILRDEIREYLNPVYDLERLISRISYQSANPRDMVAFSSSLEMLPHIRRILKEFKCPILTRICEDMDPLEDLSELIRKAIVDEPPMVQREGGIIREGYNEDVDKFRRSRTDGKKWLAELEAREKERTGIKNLKIKYNRVFGYSLEVTNSFKNLVPENYVRKQTLSNAERYITQELKELEDTDPSGCKKGAASNEMCTFLIINVSSLQLIPVNMIAYRAQYGSVNPAAIVGPAVLATAVSTGAAVIFCKIADRKRRHS